MLFDFIKKHLPTPAKAKAKAHKDQDSSSSGGMILCLVIL